MYTDYKEFSCFDFHDSYFEKVDMEENRCIWYLESVNVSPKCSQNPCACSMKASLMKVVFSDFCLEGEPVDWDKISEKGYEILAIDYVGQQNGRYTYICHIVCGEYIELQMSFTNVTFEWNAYNEKAWYVYCHEEDEIKEFLLKHPQIPWMSLNNEQRDRLAREYYSEVSTGHDLFGLEAMILAKSEAKDDILCSMSDGTSAIVHLTYAKEIKEGYPKYTRFNSVEQTLQEIYRRENGDYYGLCIVGKQRKD